MNEPLRHSDAVLRAPWVVLIVAVDSLAVIPVSVQASIDVIAYLS